MIDPGDVIGAAWLIFTLYWLVSAFAVRRKKAPEDAGSQLVRVVVLVIAFLLLYGNNPWFGVLNRRFMPYVDWVAWLGAAFTVVGVAFAIWARYHIGQYWSGAVALKVDHKLIRTGPYKRIRHPIYTGILLALTGTALPIGRYRALLALAIWLASFIWKARREEALLAREFGSAFDEHKRLTGFFLPR